MTFGYGKFGYGVMALGVALLLAPPAAAKAAMGPGSVTLQDQRATIIPASGLSTPLMTYHEGAASVRGSFRVGAMAIGDALNDRTDRPIMVFVFDRARAKQHGCALREDVSFVAMIDTPPVDGLQAIEFGRATEDGRGVMPLGVFNEMVTRGCIAVRARMPDVSLDAEQPGKPAESADDADTKVPEKSE